MDNNKNIIKFGDMVIDKSYINDTWYSNEIYGDKLDKENLPNAYYSHYISDPLTIHEYITERDINLNNHRQIHHDSSDLSYYDKLIIRMVESGDFTLKEAIKTVAFACERCKNVLFNIYYPINIDTGEVQGYSLLSDEWKSANCSCKFCENVKIPSHEDSTLNSYQQLNKILLIAFNKIKNVFSSINGNKNTNNIVYDKYINDSQKFDTNDDFIIGRYYRSKISGVMVHICGVAHTDYYDIPVLIAEYTNGKFDAFTNRDINEWDEIPQEKFLMFLSNNH